MNIETIIYALEIMGKGMLSIFIVILLLTFIVVLLAKLPSGKKSKISSDED